MKRRRLPPLLALGEEEVRILSAEFLGTFLLVLLCDSVSAQYLARQEDTRYMQVSFGIGLSVMTGVLSSIGASGAHLNPAVTTSFMLAGKFPWRHLHLYLAAEYLGAFAGAGAAYGIYADCMQNVVEPSGELTVLGASAFTSVPGAHGPSTATMALDQILCTAVLMLVILGMTDDRNCGLPLYMAPLTVGLGLVSIRLSLAVNSGCSMNPAADMAGRLMSWLATGFDEEIWSVGDYMFWIPWLMPHVGGALGVAAYYLMISAHHGGD